MSFAFRVWAFPIRYAAMRGVPGRLSGSRLIAISLILVGALGLARADDAADAKAYYQKATAHFAVGEYQEAATAYEVAFKLKQDPALLYNAAQSHRLAGDIPKALLLYKNLVKLYPTSKYATDSQEHIDKLDQTGPASASPQGGAPPVEAASTQSPSSSPTVTPTAAAPSILATAPSATAETLPTLTSPSLAPVRVSPPGPLVTASVPPAPLTKSPIYKRWWFWTAGGVALAAVVITAVAISSAGGTWSNIPDVSGAH